MRVVFYELEGWERPYLERKLPAGKDHAYEFLTRQALAGGNEDLAECEVLSPFIFSRIDGALMDRAPMLKLITTRSTGYDHIDRVEAKRRGIQVANVPEYGSNTVAEHTFALILALSRRVIPAYVRTREGRFTTEGLRGFDLRGKLLGVVGTGNIGLHVIRMALAFGMQVLAYDPYPRQVLADVLGFKYAGFDELLHTADILTLHCPATKENRHLINANSISQMQKGAVLINTARGSLVNIHDLLGALQSGQLGGAGLDVLDGERLIKEDVQVQQDADRNDLIAAIEAHKLLTLENVIVTPHNAFNSDEAVHRILDTTAQNISTFMTTGHPAFPVLLDS